MDSRTLELINKITEPGFLDKFNFINDPKSREIDIDKYKQILSAWSLNRELNAVNRFYSSKNILVDNRIKRVLSQNLFDSQCNYKENRINILINYDHKLKGV